MTDPLSTTERTSLRHAAAWLLSASIGWWVAAAALIPSDDFFAGDDARSEAISIADNAGLFRVFHVVTVLATGAGAVGVVLLARVVGRSVLARTAIVFATVGLAAWIVEALLRLTVTVSRARDVMDGTRSPGDEPAIGSWAVFAISALGFAAPMICTWALAKARVPAGRGIAVVAAFTTLVTLGSVAILAPSPVYQFPVLALALYMLIRTRRSRSASTVAAAAG